MSNEKMPETATEKVQALSDSLTNGLRIGEQYVALLNELCGKTDPKDLLTATVKLAKIDLSSPFVKFPQHYQTADYYLLFMGRLLDLANISGLSINEDETEHRLSMTSTHFENIEFRFTGVADGANQTLANEVEGAADADGTGEVGATGVGIRIYSKNTTTDGLIKLNTQTPQGSSSSAAYVIPGDAATHDFTAAFTAGYAQNGSTVAPGLVKSTASFVVLYE